MHLHSWCECHLKHNKATITSLNFVFNKKAEMLLWNGAVPRLGTMLTLYKQGPGFEPWHHIKLGMVTYAYNLSTKKVKREDRKFKVILCYTRKSRAGWTLP